MDDEAFWCIAFSTAVGWTLHPGYSSKPDGLTVDGCACVADQMLAVLQERRRLWALHSEPSPPG